MNRKLKLVRWSLYVALGEVRTCPGCDASFVSLSSGRKPVLEVITLMSFLDFSQYSRRLLFSKNMTVQRIIFHPLFKASCWVLWLLINWWPLWHQKRTHLFLPVWKQGKRSKGELFQFLCRLFTYRWKATNFTSDNTFRKSWDWVRGGQRKEQLFYRGVLCVYFTVSKKFFLNKDPSASLFLAPL